MIVVLLGGVAFMGLAVATGLRAAEFGRMRRHGVLDRVRAYGFDTRTAAIARELSLRDAAGVVATRFGRLVEQRLDRNRLRELRIRLDSAGFYRTTVTRYLGYRALAVAGPPLVLVLLAVPAGVGARIAVVALAFAALGWILPSFFVSRRARVRGEAVDREVPELVDLLVTTVEAGIGFTAALQLCASRVRGPFAYELALALREQNLGLTSQEALQNMLARVDSTVLRAFVQAILQGEQLGVSTGKILRELAVDMRKRRRRDAEERAQKAPTKILFPLVLLILPALLVVVLGPAVYAIVHQLG